VNWNNGMLEYWNDGFKETGIQNAYYFIGFLALGRILVEKARR
jgi:hypothetical protein